MQTQLSQQAEAALDRIVALSGRDRSEIATETLETYAVWLEREVMEITHARADIAAGRFLEHDAFFDQLEQELTD